MEDNEYEQSIRFDKKHQLYLKLKPQEKTLRDRSFEIVSKSSRISGWGDSYNTYNDDLIAMQP